MNPIERNIISIDGAKLLIFEITESVDELFQKLDFVDITEYSELKSDKRRLEYLGVRIALKNLLGVEKHVCYNKEGKPFFLDNSYELSISHSGRWIAVMAHYINQVGIDIEVPTDKVGKLYKRFLNETEQKELSDGKNPSQLLIAWSAKEALYKIIGQQAVDFANQLHIFPFEMNNEGIINAEHIPSKQKYLLHYIQNEAYTLVYCIA